MAARRLSEFREITASHGRGLLERYMASFAGYSEISLTVSCFVYALVTSFFLAIFLIKYRVEYLLTVPVLIALFGHYLALSMGPASTAQRPEKLFKERALIALVGLLACWLSHSCLRPTWIYLPSSSSPASGTSAWNEVDVHTRGLAGHSSRGIRRGWYTLQAAPVAPEDGVRHGASYRSEV
jgi:hypothetical protein